MKPYICTTEYTSAPSALMMVLHHFNKEFELTKENEHKIWISTVNLPVRASSIYGLAIFAKEQGLDPKIVLENKEYDFPDYRFKRYKKVDVEDAQFTSDIYYKKAVDLNIPIEERFFDLDEVKKLLSKGHVLLLRLNVGVFRDKGSMSNYVVLYKDADKFFMIDPVTGKLNIVVEMLEEAFATLETKKKRDHRMIIF